MSWLMVGIRRLHSKLRLAPLRRRGESTRAKPNRAIRFPGAERRLALAEDRAAARSCTDNLTFRSQRQRLSFLRRGVTPRLTSQESNYFQKLMGPGRPFRLAKLTACRKVRAMYRRCRPKSSTSPADMGVKARCRKDFQQFDWLEASCTFCLGRIQAVSSHELFGVFAARKGEESRRCGRR